MMIDQVYRVQIGRRIREILDERGSAFSVRAFSSRIGLSKDMLLRMISGERYIAPSELELISKGLSIRIDRLKQEDIVKQLEEVCHLLNHSSDPERALELAQRLNKVALGASERCDTLNLLARAHFDLENYDLAHNLWIEAYQLAQQLSEKYDDSERLYEILRRLLISFTARKEYTNLATILKKVEPVFAASPSKMGAICYSKAMIAEQLGNIEEVRSNLTQSLFYLEKTGVVNQIGRAKLNIGFFEFKSKNYDTAREYLEQAISILVEDSVRVVAVKEYIKTLIQLGELQKATDLIEQTIPTLGKKLDVKAKFLLLLSVAKGVPDYAEQVVKNSRYSEVVRNLSCLYLMKYYSEKGDSHMLMIYYKKAENLSSELFSDILHKEGL